ncbi:KAP family P-loop NTPase fold protein [Psychrilyobacter atlanticus]|uniref:KAP family P-loop NTPase fold protein n=1 Tax=Psychrilyobacter atlanticus TaxID=271091 RepID=UPI0004276525|nr:P-loop NTPase fold protein [Psychrilyobacter atlanticus]
MSNLILEKSDDMEYLFKNCKLEREPIADNLTKIIENLGGKGSFVLGIDSPWGTGKTTFIKMWQKKLELEKSDKIFTIHFNAWENDFYGNVLLSLIGELDKYLDNSNKDVDKEDLKKVTGNIASSVVNFMTLGIINPKELYKELDGTKKRGLFNNYKEYKDLKERIKEDLTKIKEKLGVEKVIFFIDELDRCRPDYAIETLEKIKHLFGVDDYIYVLSLDKEQLSHSVSTIYGSGMDSEGYLRRFIDLDYSLPNPSKENYLKYLMEKHNLDENMENTKHFWKVISNFAKMEDISLRDLEKLFYRIKLILPLSKLEYHKVGTDEMCDSIDIYWMVYGYFICLNQKYNELYKELVSGKSKVLSRYSSYTSTSKGFNDPLQNNNFENFEKSLKWLIFEKRISQNEILKMLKVINENCNGVKKIEFVDFTIKDGLMTRGNRLPMNMLFNSERFIIKDHIEFINNF